MDEDGESSQHVDIPGLPESEQKGGKKGKKNKAAAKKTFTLQTFLHDQENVEPVEQGGGAGVVGPGSLAAATPLTLSDKETAVLESCHSFIHDLLKQLGPTNAMDPAIHQEINNFPPEAKAVMQKLGGYRKFILRCKDLVVVDKIVAARSDLAAAQEMAFKEIYNNIPGDVSLSRHEETNNTTINNTFNNSNISSNKDIWTSSPSDAKVPMWNSTNVSSSGQPSSPLPYSKYEPFFKESHIGDSGQQEPMGHLHSNPFNSQSQDFEFLRGSSKHNQLLFGGLGSLESVNHKNGDIKSASHHFSSVNIPSVDNSAVQALESQIWKLTTTNNELLQQLADKENQLKDHHVLKQKFIDLDREHQGSVLQLGQYKNELELLRLEVARLKQGGAMEIDGTSGSGCTPRDVILHLQKQLEQELLKNRNLSQQLEVQQLHLRGENLKLVHDSLPVSVGNKLPRQNTFGGLSLTRGDDLFGLRSMTMTSGPLTDMTTVVTSAATAVPPSHSVFGAIGADLTNHRLPLSKSASVANMGFHLNLADSREPSPADLHKNLGSFLGSFNPALGGGPQLVDPVSAAAAANVAASSSKSARQEQLVKKLVTTIPGSTENIIKHYIQVLREQHGKLSGWPTSRIAAEITKLMEAHHQ